MLSDMFFAEILYMKCMNFEFEFVAFALLKPDMDANRSCCDCFCYLSEHGKAENRYLHEILDQNLKYCKSIK